MINGTTSRTRWIGRILAALALTAAITACGAADLPAAANQKWVETWSPALHPPSVIPGVPGSVSFNNETLRQIVRATVGGDRVRIRLSTIGSGPLNVAAAHIATRSVGARIVPGSDRTLTFSGQLSITIPPGATVLSDPVELAVTPLSDLAVSIYVAGQTDLASWNLEAVQTSYVSPHGDYTSTPDMLVSRTTRHLDPGGAEHLAWYWLAGVEVLSTSQTGVIVAFGDSVTSGTASTPDTNSRWTDQLARRIMAQPGNNKAAVLNKGISGNRLLNEVISSNGLARFDRDVLVRTGVTDVIVLLGNNDILFVFNPAEFVSADQLIAGHKQLIQRARARGLRIYGATLTPFGGNSFASPVKESIRTAINKWIRESADYDGVIDFDAAIRDPQNPSRIRASFDSGDGLHPNDSGYKAMADAIDLRLFLGAVQ